MQLTHVGMCVTDLERSTRFYVEALGFTEGRRMSFADESTATLLAVDGLDLELVYLDRDGFTLELLGFRNPTVTTDGTPRRMDAVGLTHLSVRVADPDAVTARIVQHGGSVQWDREVTFSGARGLMALDPDGNRIELIEWRSR